MKIVKIVNYSNNNLKSVSVSLILLAILRTFSNATGSALALPSWRIQPWLVAVLPYANRSLSITIKSSRPCYGSTHAYFFNQIENVSSAEEVFWRGVKTESGISCTPINGSWCQRVSFQRCCRCNSTGNHRIHRIKPIIISDSSETLPIQTST